MHDGADFCIIREPTVAEISGRGLAIRASCSCGHCKEIDPSKVCISPIADIIELGNILKCSRCGARGLDTMVVQWTK